MDPSVNSLTTIQTNTEVRTAMIEIGKYTPSNTILTILGTILKLHLDKIVTLLIAEENAEIKDRSDSTNRILLISLILYVVILMFFYGLWIYPKANKLNTEVKFFNFF